MEILTLTNAIISSFSATPFLNLIRVGLVTTVITNLFELVVKNLEPSAVILRPEGVVEGQRQ